MKASRQTKHLRHDIEAMRVETVAVNKLCDGNIAFSREGGRRLKR